MANVDLGGLLLLELSDKGTYKSSSRGLDFYVNPIKSQWLQWIAYISHCL